MIHWEVCSQWFDEVSAQCIRTVLKWYLDGRRTDPETDSRPTKTIGDGMSWSRTSHFSFPPVCCPRENCPAGWGPLWIQRLLGGWLPRRGELLSHTLARSSWSNKIWESRAANVSQDLILDGINQALRRIAARSWLSGERMGGERGFLSVSGSGAPYREPNDGCVKRGMWICEHFESYSVGFFFHCISRYLTVYLIFFNYPLLPSKCKSPFEQV